MLCPAEKALARSNAYGLLARLLLGEINEETLALCEVVPEIADLWRETYGDFSEGSADEAAADHFALFGRQVFPYGGYFLNRDGLVGGEETTRVLEIFQDQGFDPPSLDSHSADHIGVELQFLGYLAYRQAWALGDDKSEAAQFYERQQRTFIHDHMLQWLLPLYVAVSKEPFPFWFKILNLVLALLNDHLKDLEAYTRREVAPEPWSQEDLQAWLQQPETGLGSIVRRLAHPAESGFHLSQGQIKDLAAGAGIPLSFDTREAAIKSLIETAGDYEVLPRLLELMINVSQEWVAGLQSLGEPMEPWAFTWRQKLQQTAFILEQMKSTTLKSQQHSPESST